MKNKPEAVGLACQIAFEYEDWGDEHVYEMLQIYVHTGEKPAPCDYDELMALTCRAARLKKDGLDYAAAEAELLKPVKLKR